MEDSGDEFLSSKLTDSINLHRLLIKRNFDCYAKKIAATLVLGIGGDTDLQLRARTNLETQRLIGFFQSSKISVGEQLRGRYRYRGSQPSLITRSNFQTFFQQ